ncbi:DUF6940 family protein [Flexithrix dorotheae]|uniref:DUF6940 family protein n=1 Tax=Flexithrix dorotheae TaxID=70993 RepID=UPI000369A1DD|nr:hypothetical protein [Flexithrix dorotheae]
MWKVNKILFNDNVEKYQLILKDKPISYQDFIEGLTTSGNFRNFYNEILMNCQFPAFYWENQPVSKKDLNKPYEFVLVKSSTLVSQKPDSQAFANQFSKKNSIISFPNLGGDAQLIVPCPIAEHQNYTHLAKFIRSGLKDQIDAFWKKVGQEYSKQIGHQPKWLSTAGMGVFWLHARIDSHPKYYRFRDYKAR